MLSIQIVSPTEVIFEGDVDFLAVPAGLGQLGMLTNHAPLLSTLKRGRIKLTQQGRAKTFDISGGFLEVLRDKATVLLS